MGKRTQKTEKCGIDLNSTMGRELASIPRYECCVCDDGCERVGYSLEHLLDHPCFSGNEPEWVRVRVV